MTPSKLTFISVFKQIVVKIDDGDNDNDDDDDDVSRHKKLKAVSLFLKWLY